MHRTLLIALLLIAPAVAQDDGAPATSLLSDGVGDASVQIAGQAMAIPERMATVDLVSLAALEGEDDVTFILGLRELDAASEITYGESTRYRVAFEHNGRVMSISAARWTNFGAASVWASLYVHDPQEDRWLWQENLDAAQDEGANTLSVVVPRLLLHDDDGARPGPGRSIDGFWATAWHAEINPENLGSLVPEEVTVADRMPDAGVGDAALGFTFGPAQEGGISLVSERPSRMSNGAATTFVYHVTASNDGPSAEGLTMSAGQAPAGWNVRFPQPRFTLAAGESREVPVLVTLPFSHDHGAFHSIDVKAANDDGSAEGNVELSVQFTTIPQPAGHHSRLWLHSYAKNNGVVGDALAPLPGADHWIAMNADPEWDGASGEPVQAGYMSGITTITNQWQVQLSPLLGMGLDFDLDRQGLLTVPISTATPIEDAEAEIFLYHWSTDDRKTYDGITLASAKVPAGSWRAGEQRTIEIPFDVSDEADLIGLRDTQGIYMRISLVSPGTGANQGAVPMLEPGATLDLPLFEYHDPLEDLAGTFGLDLGIAGDAERLANPGDTVVFEAIVRNQDTEKRHIDLGVQGNAADWVALEQDHVALDGGDTARIVFTVAVPAGTPDGELADLVLEAVADDGSSALERLRVVVDTDAEHHHDVLAEATSEAAPGPTVLLLLAGLAGAGWGRRRKN